MTSVLRIVPTGAATAPSEDTDDIDAAVLQSRSGPLTLRRARRRDLGGIVRLLGEDEIGSGRESPDADAYVEAFERVMASPGDLLVVAEGADGGLVATMQLTLLHGLSRRGATRVQLEGVRVAAASRGQGIGEVLLDWAAQWGRQNGASLAQLTTDKRRVDAHRFYARLGWVATHEGMKLEL